MSLENERIGFIGGGAMAEALLGGLLAAGVARERLRASDPEAARRQHLARQLGIDEKEIQRWVADKAQHDTEKDNIIKAKK